MALNQALSEARLRRATAEFDMPKYVLAGLVWKATNGKIRITPSDAGRIIEGRQVPTLAERLAIAQVLGKPVDWLFPKEEAEKTPDEAA